MYLQTEFSNTEISKPIKLEETFRNFYQKYFPFLTKKWFPQSLIKFTNSMITVQINNSVSNFILLF